MKKIFNLSAVMCLAVTAVLSGCGNSSNSESTNDDLQSAESIEDIADTLNELTDEEILSMGIAPIPDFTITIDNNGEEIVMNKDSIKPFATIETEAPDYDSVMNLWRGVFMIDVIEFLGVTEFTTLIIEGVKDGEPKTVEYTKNMVHNSIFAYGVDGSNIDGVNGKAINAIILDNSSANALSWVEDVQKITVFIDPNAPAVAPEDNYLGELTIEDILNSGAEINFEVEGDDEVDVSGDGLVDGIVDGLHDGLVDDSRE